LLICVATFHSYPELLHAALLEGNKNVLTYTPQPEMFKINGRRYIPDCRYIENGKTIYVEIKPKGELIDKVRIPMEEYAAIHDCEFKVISNEDILDQEVKAKNWLSIVRVLVSAKNEETQGAEDTLINWLCSEPELTLKDIIDSNDRVSQRFQEIALYRLAHKGIINLDIETKPIEYTTKVNLCHHNGN